MQAMCDRTAYLQIITTTKTRILVQRKRDYNLTSVYSHLAIEPESARDGANVSPKLWK